MIAGETKSSAGSITINGVSLHSDKLYESLGYCPEFVSLISEGTTVLDNLDYARQVRGIPEEQKYEVINEVINVLRLNEYLDHKTVALSTGLKRKLMLAIALINKPKVLILDDPSIDFDADSKRQLWEYLTSIKEDRIIVIASQEFELIQKHADRVCILQEGMVKLIGEPEVICKENGSGFKIIIEAKRTMINEQQFKALIPEIQMVAEN